MNLARVVAVHPESHRVDLLFLATNQRVPGVRVMSGAASSSSGMFGLATPTSQKAADPYDDPTKGDRVLIACVGYFDGQPVVHGFIFPEVSEILFADPDRVMHRTPSDFYHTVDGAGNAEWFHPSGAYVRIATDPAHEDLRGKDYNGKFNPKRNAGNKVHIHIEQAGGTASVNIAPDGAIVIKSAATLLAEVADTVTVKAGGATTVEAPSVLIDSPETHITGTLLVDGAVTIKAGMTSTGDVVADGISLTKHPHGGVKAGPDTSGKPQ